MPTPAPFYFDQTAAILPGPYLVTEFMEGQTQFAPLNLDDFLLQMASNLARLHSFDWSLYDLSFLAHQSHHYDLTFATPPARLDNTLDEGRIRAALTPAWPFPHRNLSVLLHGDYWPGNILWRNDRLAAVIDWEDAHLGDPLADLAISRLEILWAFDLDAMRLFTNYYRRASNLDFTALPYWDLCAALRPAFQIATWAGNPTREQAMREKHLLFVSQAFDALPA
jgi:aminoglycoside phosphotransferase (APT) family kinase protein